MPAEVLERWGLDEGGTVEVADLGRALVVRPTGRTLLGAAIVEAGGYPQLAEVVSELEPGLN